jgi:hypothetical protein
MGRMDEIFFPKVAPRDGLVILDERPPLGLGRVFPLACFVERCFPRLVRWYCNRRQLRLQPKLRDLMAACAQCRERAELERLLGEPYGLSGEGHGLPRPDFTECYQRGDFRIELCFLNKRVVEMIGAIRPSVWDIACGVAKLKDPDLWELPT